MSLTAQISNTIKDPSGVAVAGVAVTATLLPGPGFRIDDGTEVAEMVSTTSDGSGHWTLTLEQTANINPAGTYYLINEAIPAAQGGPDQWVIQVGGSNATLQASLVTPPPALAVATYLTQATGDARYLQLANAPATNIQIFTAANGTWTKPTGGYTRVEVVCIGGGGGGGSGRRGAAATIRCGGGGGASGGVGLVTFPYSSLPSSVPILVGQGSAGGAAQTVDSTNGVSAAGGGDSVFGTTTIYVYGRGGGGGQGGTASSGTAGTAGQIGDITGQNGGGASAGGGNGLPGGSGIGRGTGAGGGGGGINASNTVGFGASGGNASYLQNSGGSDGIPATPGGSSAVNQPLGGAGGGGGDANGSGAGGTGGNGGIYGGGGGGGGASLNGNNSGAGGNGGAGIVIVYTS